MTNHDHRNDPASLAERKRQLIAQGAAFRARVMQSKENARAGLRPDVLAKGAVGLAFPAMLAMFKRKSGAPHAAHATAASSPGAGLDLRTILPLVITAATALSKKRLPKPVLRGALLLGAVGAVAALVVHMKNARTARKM
jgi:hypothetical protein